MMKISARKIELLYLKGHNFNTINCGPDPGVANNNCSVSFQKIQKKF